MTEQELKKEQFIAKAMANKENFKLHKNLIEEYLCGGGEMYIADLKAFYERQVVDNQLLLNLMEYAEDYALQASSDFVTSNLRKCIEEQKGSIEMLHKLTETLKNKNRVLENLNFKYREKLGISNEPMDLGLVSPLDEVPETDR